MEPRKIEETLPLDVNFQSSSKFVETREPNTLYGRNNNPIAVNVGHDDLNPFGSVTIPAIGGGSRNIGGINPNYGNLVGPSHPVFSDPFSGFSDLDRRTNDFFPQNVIIYIYKYLFI
jgi:hypothetical protein